MSVELAVRRPALNGTRHAYPRRSRLFFSLTFTVAFVALTACATTPGVYRVTPPAVAQVFPPPPETPRYQYVGSLRGETNFETAKGTRRPWLTRAWYWFVGLAFGQEGPYQLARPQSGASDDDTGRVYVCDTGRAAVVVFDRAEGRLYHWDDATPRDRFKAPVALTVGPRNEIWVSDAELGFIARLNDKGAPIGTIGKGILKHPVGIVWDGKGGMAYVADAALHTVIKFDSDGREVGRIGKPGNQPGEFNAPTHVAFANGELYVSDSLNSRVQRFDAEGVWRSALGRRGMNIGDLPRPKGVAVDGGGRIYVVESYYDYLLVYDHENRLLLAIGGSGTGGGQFYLPAGVWSDTGGRIYVADMYNGRVEVFQFMGDDSVAPNPTPIPGKVP